MATKKKAKKPSAKTAKKKAARKPPPRERLAAFFRKLYKQPKLMAQFSSSAAGREQVLEKSNLTMEHRNLLASGCLRDTIVALSGATCVVNCTIVVGDDMGKDSLLCSHPDCQAFRSVKPA